MNDDEISWKLQNLSKMVDFLVEENAHRHEMSQFLAKQINLLHELHRALRQDIFKEIDNLIEREKIDDSFLRERVDAVFYKVFPEVFNAEAALEQAVLAQKRPPKD